MYVKAGNYGGRIDEYEFNGNSASVAEVLQLAGLQSQGKLIRVNGSDSNLNAKVENGARIVLYDGLKAGSEEVILGEGGAQAPSLLELLAPAPQSCGDMALDLQRWLGSRWNCPGWLTRIGPFEAGKLVQVPPNGTFLSAELTARLGVTGKKAYLKYGSTDQGEQVAFYEPLKSALGLGTVVWVNGLYDYKPYKIPVAILGKGGDRWIMPLVMDSALYAIPPALWIRFRNEVARLRPEWIVKEAIMPPTTVDRSTFENTWKAQIKSAASQELTRSAEELGSMEETFRVSIEKNRAARARMKELDKEMENILERTLGEIRRMDGVAEVEVLYPYIIAKTKDLTVKSEPFGERRVGEFYIRFDVSARARNRDGELSALRIESKGNIVPSGAMAPHVFIKSAESPKVAGCKVGSACWGNAEAAVRLAAATGDAVTVFALALELLKSYNHGDAGTALTEWPLVNEPPKPIQAELEMTPVNPTVGFEDAVEVVGEDELSEFVEDQYPEDYNEIGEGQDA